MLSKLRIQPLEDRLAPAAVGQLDLTFGQGGITVPNVVLNTPSVATPGLLGIQPDGRILVGSTAFFANGDSDFAMYRLNTDGSIDTTYGNKGLATVEFDLGGTNADTLSAITVLADGSVILVGTAAGAGTDTDFAVAKLTANGLLDLNFNITGKKVIAFNLGGTNADAATSVAIDSLGRVVLAGSVARPTAGDFDFALVRLTSTGTLDNAFSADGKTTLAFDLAGSTLEDKAMGVGIGLNNTIVVVGNVNSGGLDVDAGVARFTSAGNLDNTFDGDGSRVYGLDVPGTTQANTAVGVVVLSDGRIVFTGTVARTAAGDTDFYVARLKADSTADTTFGGTGFVPAGFSLGGAKQDTAYAVAVDSLGRVVVAGSVQINASDVDFGIVRFLANGTLDTSFDVDGGQQVPFDKGGTNVDIATAIALQNNGAILLAGPVSLSTGAAIGVARINGTIGIASTLAVSGPITGAYSNYQVNTANQFAPDKSFTPFPGYTGPTRTATADFNGDGVSDTVAVIGPGGGSFVRIIDGATGGDIVSKMATYEPQFTGGLFVAAGDMDGDGRAEFAVGPDVGGGGRVQVFTVSGNGLLLRDNFFGIDDLNFRGGARVAIGDVDADGRQELIVAAGFGGGPRVAIFDGQGLLAVAASPPKLIGDFFAFPGTDAVTLRNGVFVTAGDLDGDGYADLVFGGGPGGGPRVFALSGKLISQNLVANSQANPIANFFVGNDIVSRGGIRLAVKDIDDDHRADLVTGSGENEDSVIHVYLGTAFPSANGSEPTQWEVFDPFNLNLINGVFVG